MRLHQIEIENFGVFRGSCINFGDGRFHLICGPNEAGKSTLLQLIRELLFGFAAKNPYAFQDHDGEMAATVAAEMKDGTRIRFRRRKGRVHTVTGEVEGTDRTFDDMGLVRLLGNANAELYQNIFGFSLAELASGEESLKHARLEEALYGGGLGGLANFQQTLATIQKEHQALFAAKAKVPQINKLLGSIHDTSTKLGQAMVKPRDYKDLCQRRDSCAAQVEGLLTVRDNVFRRQAHLERLAEALPLWQGLCQAKEQLASLDVPDTFPLAIVEEFRQLRSQLHQVREDAASADDEFDEVKSELAQVHLAPELIEKESIIKQLVQQIAQIKSCRHDIPLRRHEAEASRNQALAMVSELQPDWDLSQLEKFRTSLSQRSGVDRMAKEFAALRDQAQSLALRRKEKNALLAKDLQELERLKAIPAAPQVEGLSQRAGQYEVDRETIEQLESQLAALDGQIARLRQQIAGQVGIASEHIESLPVPLNPAVQEFSRTIAAAADELRQATKEHNQAQRDLARGQEELNRIDASQHVPDRDALIAQRNRRDAGWQLVRRVYVEGQTDERDVRQWLGDGAASLPDRYEEEVAEADHLADTRQDKAEIVAKRDQLAADVVRLENRLREANADLSNCQRNRDGLEQSWQELWNACRLSPKSPEVMAEWLRLHAQLADKHQDCLEPKRRLQQIQQRVSAFERELQTALVMDGNPDDLLMLAQQRTELARDASLQIARLNRDLPARRDELEQLGKEADNVTRQQELWNGRWQELLQELGFPTTWDVILASQTLSELTKARDKYLAVGVIETRVREMAATVGEFEHRTKELCASLAQDIKTLPAEDAISQLNDRVTEAKQATEHHATLLKQYRLAEARAESKHASLQRLSKRLVEIREMAKVASDDDFDQLAADAAQHKSLCDEIKTLQRDMDRIAANEDAASFEEELVKTESDELYLALQKAKEEHTLTCTEYERAVGDAALAKKDVEKLDQQHDANDLAQKLESNRAELRTAVEHWAPLVLAEITLTEAIARFEREHQPAMLRDVGLLFSKLTHNRYTGLRRKLNEQGSLLIEDSRGNRKEPGELSTGTREQLYLAIRLAYARHYCKDNEPLPLVMDDVIVNFDDERSDAAVDLLLELAQDIQVVFLTCHQTTIQRIQSRIPALHPTLLNGQFVQ